jgi:hypothetical protein
MVRVNESMEIELPEALPIAYVKWVEWWNGVDHAVSQNQLLQTMLSWRTMTGRAGLAWRGNRFRSVVDQVELQAFVAEQLRDKSIRPSITAPGRVLGDLGEAMDITARFVRWWSEHPEAAEAVGLPRPTWQVELLHAAAGDAIRSRAGTVVELDDVGPPREPVVDLVERRVAVQIPPRIGWTKVAQ